MSSKEAKIVPLKGNFESVAALLARVAEDADEIDSLVVMVYYKDGTAAPFHIGCTKYQMCFAGAVISSVGLK